MKPGRHTPARAFSMLTIQECRPVGIVPPSLIDESDFRPAGFIGWRGPYEKKEKERWNKT